MTSARRVPTIVSWSGGKDSALALHALLAVRERFATGDGAVRLSQSV